MKNREWLLQQDQCDLLKTINKKIKNADDSPCIMDSFMTVPKVIERCNKYIDDCNKCIEHWMNEENK